MDPFQLDVVVVVLQDFLIGSPAPRQRDGAVLTEPHSVPPAPPLESDFLQVPVIRFAGFHLGDQGALHSKDPTHVVPLKQAFALGATDSHLHDSTGDSTTHCLDALQSSELRPPVEVSLDAGKERT